MFIKKHATKYVKNMPKICIKICLKKYAKYAKQYAKYAILSDYDIC